LRAGCRGEYFGLRGTGQQEIGENFILRRLNILLLTKYSRLIKWRKIELFGHVASMVDGELHKSCCWGNEVVGESVILKWIISKYNVVLGTVLSWLRIGTGSGQL
jgi:hypothetical protein